jgi:spore germination cell wall hydrolase CwlJ-like protein
MLTAQALCVVGTIFLEARSEKDLDAMAAVADTIMTRSAQRNLSPCQVVNQKGQYATGEVNLEYMQPADREAYDRAKDAALKAFNGNGLGLDADHFHTVTTLPYWAKGQQPVARIGNHLFYKLD